MRTVAALLMTLALSAAGAAQVAGQAATPSPEPAALPDAASFLAAAKARVATAADDFIRFSHRERYTEIGFNPFGNLGTGPNVLSDVFPSADDDYTYRRVLERGGKPVKDLLEQDRKYQARLEAHRRELTGERQSTRVVVEKASFIEKARQAATVRETLDLFTFAIESRTIWDGEPAIIVRFTPMPGRDPQTNEARVAYAFAGRAWVHEGSHDVMHLEAQAVDDVSFGYGFVGRLYKGSALNFTRQKIQGTWLPALTLFKGSARVLFRTTIIDFRREYFDYQAYTPADLPSRLGWTR